MPTPAATSRRPLLLALAVLALAPAALPAGNVRASKLNGRLKVHGDRQDNQVTITELAPGSWQVTGQGDTTVNGQPSVLLEGIDGAVRVHLGAGDDELSITGGDVQRGLTVDGGTGTDQISLADVSVGARLTLRTRRGSDVLTLTGVDVAGSLRVRSGPGDDELSATTSTFRDKGRINAEAGSDRIAFTGVTAESRLRVRLRRGKDGLTLTGSTFQRIRADGGQGKDALVDGGGNTYIKQPKAQDFEADSLDDLDP